jgi:hypothetical protein
MIYRSAIISIIRVMKSNLRKQKERKIRDKLKKKIFKNKKINKRGIGTRRNHLFFKAGLRRETINNGVKNNSKMNGNSLCFREEKVRTKMKKSIGNIVRQK